MYELLTIALPTFPDCTKELGHGDDFGYCSVRGMRDAQEDALTLASFDNAILNKLSSEAIGQRLWTTYQLLDENLLSVHKEAAAHSGTTASTTVYDGKGYLITATVGDAVNFAVIYGHSDQVLGVVRLNKLLHKPDNPKEKQRIRDTKGTLFNNRLWGPQGCLSVTRAIGDHDFRPHVIPNPTIDIIDIQSMVHQLSIPLAKVKKIHIIATSDGFTDAALSSNKEGQEHYLMTCLLNYYQIQTEYSQTGLAEYLCNRALADNSIDNISAAVHMLDLSNPKSFLIGAYDGHGGALVSTFVAEHIYETFKTLCLISDEVYEAEALSAAQNLRLYEKDNPCSISWRDSTNKEERLIVKDIKETIQHAVENYHTHYHHPSCQTRGHLNGWFSWFRHGNYGLQQANNFKTKALTIGQVVGMMEFIETYLSDEKTPKHIHSFSQYLLDEVSKLLIEYDQTILFEPLRGYTEGLKF